MKCCPHRGADHKPKKGETSTTAPGSPCTVPACRCKGWVPRVGTTDRGDGVKSTPSPNRRGARIFINGAGPFPTEWVDGVQRFRANPIIVELLDLQRGDKVAEELEAKGWSVDTKIIDRGENTLDVGHVKEIYRLAGCTLDEYKSSFPDDVIRYRVTSAGVR